jgi:hypothetical protein
MLTSAFVFFVSCLDACLDAVGVRPPLDWNTFHSYLVQKACKYIGRFKSKCPVRFVYNLLEDWLESEMVFRICQSSLCHLMRCLTPPYLQLHSFLSRNTSGPHRAASYLRVAEYTEHHFHSGRGATSPCNTTYNNDWMTHLQENGLISKVQQNGQQEALTWPTRFLLEGTGKG